MRLICDGQSVSLDGDIVVDSVSYEPYKIKGTIVGNELLSSVGFFTQGEPMRVKIKGYLRGDIAGAKRELARLLVPNKMMSLDDGTGYFLDIFASSGLDMSSAEHLQGKVQGFVINAIAPSPLWHTEEKSQLFYSCAGVSTDKNAINITNEGDVSVGVVLRVLAVTKLDSVMVRIGDKRIAYEAGLESGDVLFIDTRYGKKSVRLQRGGAGELFSKMELVSPSSDFFEIEPGENRIDFNIVNGMSYITVYHTPTFLR